MNMIRRRPGEGRLLTTRPSFLPEDFLWSILTNPSLAEHHEKVLIELISRANTKDDAVSWERLGEYFSNHPPSEPISRLLQLHRPPATQVRVNHTQDRRRPHDSVVVGFGEEVPSFMMIRFSGNYRERKEPVDLEEDEDVVL